jgi:hypothetical protein
VADDGGLPPLHRLLHPDLQADASRRGKQRCHGAVTTNKVTGAISLTSMTIDDAGQQVPAKEAANPNIPLLFLLVFIQVILFCMIYGPIAAYLVEAFPARIRYTSLSLPYHIGNGWWWAACS